MQRYRFLIARSGFALLFLGITLIQLFSFPGQFTHMRREQGTSLILEITLTFLVGVWLMCGQLALAALWKITGEMEGDQFFGPRSLLWIDRLLIALKAACLFPVILFALLVPQADDPGFFVLLSVVILFLLVLTSVASLLRDQIKSKAS